jgi:hypothetical protein
MMKKVKAFSIFELMALVCVLNIIVIFIILLVTNTHIHSQNKTLTQFQVGDNVYIDALSITGIVDNINNLYDIPRATLLIKSTNGTPTSIENVDVRLLKKVHPSPEDQWKR